MPAVVSCCWNASAVRAPVDPELLVVPVDRPAVVLVDLPIVLGEPFDAVAPVEPAVVPVVEFDDESELLHAAATTMHAHASRAMADRFMRSPFAVAAAYGTQKRVMQSG